MRRRPPDTCRCCPCTSPPRRTRRQRGGSRRWSNGSRRPPCSPSRRSDPSRRNRHHSTHPSTPLPSWRTRSPDTHRCSPCTSPPRRTDPPRRDTRSCSPCIRPRTCSPPRNSGPSRRNRHHSTHPSTPLPSWSTRSSHSRADARHTVVLGLDPLSSQIPDKWSHVSWTSHVLAVPLQVVPLPLGVYAQKLLFKTLSSWQVSCVQTLLSLQSASVLHSEG